LQAQHPQPIEHEQRIDKRTGISDHAHH
jgi:hypothetical protein